MNISIIATMSENRVIGKSGHIPREIQEEKKYFKDLTSNNMVVMDKQTYEEIGEKLSCKRKIIISSTLKLDNDCIVVPNLSDVLNIINNDENVFIIGGRRLYEEAMQLATTIYLTIIHKYIDGDTFFPEIDESRFFKTNEKTNIAEIPYTYYTYKAEHP